MGAASGVWDPVFSNFHIEPDDSHVEGEFQAAKHEGHRIRQLVILRARKPGQAKKFGREWRLTDDELVAWNSRRVDVMLALVDKKVREWDYVAKVLLDSGNNNIVEFNKHHDNFWGDCTCARPPCHKIGQNWLGETLMLVRRSLTEGRLFDEQAMHTLAIGRPPHSRSHVS